MPLVLRRPQHPRDDDDNHHSNENTHTKASAQQPHQHLTTLLSRGTRTRSQSHGLLLLLALLCVAVTMHWNHEFFSSFQQEQPEYSSSSSPSSNKKLQQPSSLSQQQDDDDMRIQIQHCWIAAHRATKAVDIPHQFQDGVPALTSVVPSFNTNTTMVFSLTHIAWPLHDVTGKGKRRNATIVDSINWKCHYNSTTASSDENDDESSNTTTITRPAQVIEQGCPKGLTLAVQCPSSLEEEEEPEPFSWTWWFRRRRRKSSIRSTLHAIQFQDYVYPLESLQHCAQQELDILPNHPETPARFSLDQLVHSNNDNTKKKKTKKKRPPRIVASMTVEGKSPQELVEWILYHSYLGITDFWIYLTAIDDSLKELWNTTTTNILTDHLGVVWIPYDLNPYKHQVKPNQTSHTPTNFYLFQNAANLDALHRAKRTASFQQEEKIDWLVFMDIDEFLVVRNRTQPQGALSQLLASSSNQMDAIQMPSVGFGSIPNSTSTTTKSSNPYVLKEYIHRSVHTFGEKWRVKTILRPSRVDYFDVHWVVWPPAKELTIELANPSDLWIHHYRRPSKGIFGVASLQNTSLYIQDTAVRDDYASIISQHAEWILLSLQQHNKIQETTAKTTTMTIPKGFATLRDLIATPKPTSTTLRLLEMIHTSIIYGKTFMINGRMPFDKHNVSHQ